MGSWFRAVHYCRVDGGVNTVRNKVVDMDVYYSAGQEILNSIAVISTVVQIRLKDTFPTDWLTVEREIKKIQIMVSKFFASGDRRDHFSCR